MSGQRSGDALQLWATYWPSRTGLFLWQDFQAGEIRRDFELIAAAGINRLLLTLPWSDFQPDARRVSLQSMRSLDQTLQLAADLGINSLVSVLSVRSLGNSTIPGWVREIDTSMPGQARRVIRNLYADPDVVASERQALEEIVGEFAGHPAVDGWPIADRFASITPPPSAEALEEWLDRVIPRGTLTENRLWHGFGTGELAHLPSLDVSALPRHGVGPFVHLDWRPTWASDDQVWDEFVSGYALSLSGAAPVVVEEASANRSSIPAGGEDMYEAIQRLRNAGAGGVVVQGVFDSPSEAERNRLWPETAGRSWPGLLTQEGVLTEAGLGWVRALNERLDVIRPSLPDIDPRARERDPELLMREAFDAFTR